MDCNYSIWIACSFEFNSIEPEGVIRQKRSKSICNWINLNFNSLDFRRPNEAAFMWSVRLAITLSFIAIRRSLTLDSSFTDRIRLSFEISVASATFSFLFLPVAKLLFRLFFQLLKIKSISNQHDDSMRLYQLPDDRSACVCRSHSITLIVHSNGSSVCVRAITQQPNTKHNVLFAKHFDSFYLSNCCSICIFLVRALVRPLQIRWRLSFLIEFRHFNFQSIGSLPLHLLFMAVASTYAKSSASFRLGHDFDSIVWPLSFHSSFVATKFRHLVKL